jgi:hypothetical protein
MHHEAIFEGVAALNRPIVSIDTLHSQLQETIAWFSTDASLMVQGFDHFDETFRIGKSQIESELRRRFELS